MTDFLLLPELKDIMKIGASRTEHDSVLEVARFAGCADVRRITGRSFEKATTASARVFPVATSCDAWVDDFYSLTDLAIATDDNDDGTFETTWTAADYELHPLNGRLLGRVWPYHRIHAVESRWFRTTGREAVVQVTALWGWAQVPDEVRLAAAVFAMSREKIRDLVNGEGGFTRWSREDAAEMLRPYVRPDHGIGIA